MKTNILQALVNLEKLDSYFLPERYSSPNRMISMGIALEYFMKDAFCNAFGVKSIQEKERAYQKYLSYIGNPNNPPDFIIKSGDAVEVKKIENYRSSIALNSSYPKDKLYSDSPMITRKCRECESWEAKDIIYAVGVIRQKHLKLLWLIYGDCYAADREVYEKTRNKIITGVEQSNGLELSGTRELGRINRVDPLGITYLRIRGMWGIENPTKVYGDIIGETDFEKTNIFALMRNEKYDSFPKEDKDTLNMDNFSVKDIEIKDPNNPAKPLKAKLIKIRK